MWQLWRQCPAAFEFNEALLADVADAAYAGAFGTFLLDCEREREAAGVFTKTASLWAHVLVPGRRRAGYLNPAYAEGFGACAHPPPPPPTRAPARAAPPAS